MPIHGTSPPQYSGCRLLGVCPVSNRATSERAVHFQPSGACLSGRPTLRLKSPAITPVLARRPLAAPGVVGGGDAGDFLFGQLAVGAVHHAAELPGIDEEHVAAAVAELAVLPVTREEPQARRDLRRVEELARQRDHAVHE